MRIAVIARSSLRISAGLSGRLADSNAAAVLACDAVLEAQAGNWFVREVIGLLRRTLSRLDVTSRSMLALVEEGHLGLDQPVNEVLRSWKVPESPLTATSPVTLRGLLTHTAGLTVHGFPGYASGEAIPSTPGVLSGAGNTDPVVAIESPPDGDVVLARVAVSFQGSGTDAEDGLLTGGALQWTSDLEGILGTGASIAYTLAPGLHRVTASVTDSSGASDAAEITINVGSPPAVTISTPADGTVLFTGALPLTLAGTATDAEDGTLSSQLEWRSDRDGLLGVGASIAAGLSVGTHAVTAAATDSDALTGEATITEGGNQISSNVLVYNIVEQRINADSTGEEDGRVRITYTPANGLDSLIPENAEQELESAAQELQDEEQEPEDDEAP